jgi:hypothetical protein
VSVLVSDLINRALVTLMEPRARRTTRPMLLQFFNETQHDIAVSLRCLELDYYFPLEANEGAYSYPEDRVQLKKLRVTQNPAPNSLGDYYPLTEMFEDEFTGATSMSRPAGYVSHYFARPEWFELVNSPPADIVNGGLLTVVRIPVWIVAEATGLTMELPDFCQTVVQKGMELKARWAGRDRVAANDEWAKWKQDSLAEIEQRISDPSIDRRANLRPPSSRRMRGLR